MKILVTNVGPVRNAQVDLRRLTVLVGPNNTGKSIVTAVIYALLDQNFGSFSGSTFRTPARAVIRSFPDEDSPELAFILDLPKRSELPALDEVPPLLRETMQELLESGVQTYGQISGQELERAVGADARELRRIQSKHGRSRITFFNEVPRWQMSLSITTKGIRVRCNRPDLGETWDNVMRDRWRAFRRRISTNVTFSGRFVFQELCAELIRACFHEMPSHTRYLPAARSGLMQSHKALAGSLVRRASFAGIHALQIPAMSAVVTDFLGEMIEVDPRRVKGYDVEARRLEQEILHGVIKVSTDVAGAPEIIYSSSDGEFPLGRTSSMISELAPVIVYLRYVLQENDLLLIEEPEAHLHPSAQVAFARSIVRLVNSGLRVGVTTHSEFFLQQLNNAIVAKSLSTQEARTLGYDEKQILSPIDVSAYLFVSTDEGTDVVAVPVLPDEGISDSSFAEVAEKLYTESVALDQTVSNGTEA